MLRRFNCTLAVLLVVVFTGIGFGQVHKPTVVSKTCVTVDCHSNFGDKEHVHGPVSLGDCKACHKSLDAGKHTWELARKGRDLCEYCHLDQAAKKNVHAPVKDGDCMVCHDPHSSDNKFLLPAAKVSEVCNSCHETGEGMKYLHGPTAVGQCTICHNPHSSDEKSLLTMKASELCFSCHVVTKNELKNFEFVHKPAADNCIGCHSGHGANNPKMLKAQAPELCYSCHEDIKKVAESSKYPHTVVTMTDGCLKCHTPHASTIRYGLKAAPASLCESCHDKPVSLGDDKILASFTKQVKNKKYLHGPVADKDCKGCHTAHGSDHFRLLVKEYPPQFYSPFKKENYALCFSCHLETLVLTKETTDLTDFRNGNLNLHYLHVNKAERGRTCRSCHATHASNLPKHIRKSVPYGTWDLPIQFEKTETGGGCAPGCHLPYKYDRVTPVKYEKP